MNHMKIKTLLAGLLTLAVSSCVGWQGQECAESPCVYKRASFRTWQLFDSVDSRYTPFRLSRGTDIVSSGDIRFVMPSNTAAWGQAEPEELDSADDDAQGAAPPSGEGGKTPELWPIKAMPSAQVAGSAPHSGTDETDINLMLERADLKALAALCCRGMKGRLYFLPGRRITPTYSCIMGGLRNNFVPYLPASFLAEGEVRTARLLDNLWLLYQLEVQGWVEPVASLDGCRWRWSRKAAALAGRGGRVQTLAGMTPQQREYFAGLSLVAPGACASGDLPPIPCRVVATEEAVSDRVDELRDGEGYPGNIGLFCLTDGAEGLVAINPEHESAWRAYLAALPQKQTVTASEKGLKVILSPGEQQALAPHRKELYAGRAAAYQFDVFVCEGSLSDYYGTEKANSHLRLPDEKRRPVLIYEGK